MVDEENLRAAVASAGDSIAELEHVPASRLAWPGRTLKRGMRRMARFVLHPQLRFDKAVYSALEESVGVLAEHARRLAGLEPIGEHVRSSSAHLEQLAQQTALLNEQTAQQMALLNELQSRLQGLEASVEGGARDLVARVEGLEGFLPALMKDIHSDFAELRAVQASMGRQIDEVGGELVANTIDVKKIRKQHEGLDARTAADQELADDRIRTLEKRFEPLKDLDHFDFARTYRGDEAEISARLEKYARNYGDVRRVLDFGCGRGEFLAICSRLDIGAYGVDLDPDMISHCKLQGLDVLQVDGLEHLRGLPARSLDGIFSSQVVEHMTPAEIVELIGLASEKLKRGAKIILETINPNTWSAMRWFYLDPSHSQPVPADMLRFFLEEANFEVLDTIYSSPVAEGERLSFMKIGTQKEDSALAEFLKVNNDNVQRLNELLFGPQDYAIIAER